ncbi:MAG: glutathione S-transferase [bacterium]
MTETNLITLHHLNNSRSQRILWMLEEAQLPYAIEKYQRDSITMLAPSSLMEIHPLGKSPVISYKGETIAESGAIIEYLADMSTEVKLKPEKSDPHYYNYLFWMHYAEGSVMPYLLLRLVFNRISEKKVPFFVKPIVNKIVSTVMDGFVTPNIDRSMDFINSHLEQNEWFAGTQLSGADIQMSFPLESAVARNVIKPEHQAIKKYVDKIHARPAYQKALEQGGEYEFA